MPVRTNTKASSTFEGIHIECKSSALTAHTIAVCSDIYEGSESRVPAIFCLEIEGSDVCEDACLPFSFPAKQATWQRLSPQKPHSRQAKGKACERHEDKAV